MPLTVNSDEVLFWKMPVTLVPIAALIVTVPVPVPPFAPDAIGPPWACDPADLLWLAWAPACYPFNLTGQPAATVCAGIAENGMPVGLQLVGRVRSEFDVVRAAAAFERARAGPIRFPI